jgi:hypothetical protein
VTVTVVLPPMLKDLVAGTAEIPVDLGGESAPLSEVLDLAFAEHRILVGKVRDERGRLRPHVKVFVDGEDVAWTDGLETSVPPSARVHVVNAVSGG